MNNLDRYDKSEIAQSEKILRSHASLSGEAVASQVTGNISTEVSFLSLVEQSQDEDIKENVDSGSARHRRAHTGAKTNTSNWLNQYGLRPTISIASHLHIGRNYVEEQKQLIFTTIQDYLFEHEPSLRPPGWTNEQRGVPAPAMEEVIMGLFGILSASELANYERTRRRGRRRR